MSPALAGGCLSTAPAGRSCTIYFWTYFILNQHPGCLWFCFSWLCWLLAAYPLFLCMSSSFCLQGRHSEVHVVEALDSYLSKKCVYFSTQLNCWWSPSPWLNRYEFEQTLGDGEGQGNLGCCSPWGCKETDMTKWLNKNESVVVCYSSHRKLIQLLYFCKDWIRTQNLSQFKALAIKTNLLEGKCEI